jgi:hypothetical protein
LLILKRSPKWKAMKSRTHHRFRWPWMFLVCVLASVACERPEAGALRDYYLDNVPAWTLQEQLRLGDADLPRGFSGVTGVEVDEQGRLYVLDRGEHEVRVFDAQGQSVNRFGRQGEGPGELLFPSGFGLFGDTLWVRNGNGHRITFFMMDGELHHTLSIQERVNVAEEGALPVYAVLGEAASGALAYPHHVFPISVDAAESFDDSVQVRRVRFGSAGEVIEIGGLESVFPRFPGIQIQVQGLSFPVQTKRFPDSPIRFGDPDAPVVVYRSAPNHGDAGVLTLVWLDDTGNIARRATYGFDPVPVSASTSDSLLHVMAQAHEDNLGNIFGRAPTAARIQQVLEETVEVPPFLPPVTDAHLGRDGSIWLRRESLRDPVPWTVLGSEGAPLGEIFLPVDAEVQLATLEEVWVVVRDDLGVPYVVRYEVERGA